MNTTIEKRFKDLQFKIVVDYLQKQLNNNQSQLYLDDDMFDLYVSYSSKFALCSELYPHNLNKPVFMGVPIMKLDEEYHESNINAQNYGI